MPETFNGCSYTHVWASPSNWETISEKKSLTANWFVQTNFFDPSIPDQPKDGFQFRRKLNRIKGVENRREAVRIMLAEIPVLLQQQGYNPITGAYMAPPEPARINRNPQYNQDTPIKNALDLAYRNSPGKHETLSDIRSVKRYFKMALRKMGYHTMPIGQVTNLHVRQTMELLVKQVRPLTDKRYNKYIDYLSGLFRVLRQDGVINNNPIEDFRKKVVVKSLRKTLTLNERRKVKNRLQSHFPEFYNFSMVFFHSGGRIIELLRLKTEDVDLDRMVYKTLVLKGGLNEWIERPIKEIAVDFWIRALVTARRGQYVFSEGLVPGWNQIRREQITRRWRVHIKEKLGIEADFYSMKHTNLDEISKIASLQEAARAAGHTSTRMVQNNYAVTLKEREMETVRKIANEFAPEIGSKNKPKTPEQIINELQTRIAELEQENALLRSSRSAG